MFGNYLFNIAATMDLAITSNAWSSLCSSVLAAAKCARFAAAFASLSAFASYDTPKVGVFKCVAHSGPFVNLPQVHPLIYAVHTELAVAEDNQATKLCRPCHCLTHRQDDGCEFSPVHSLPPRRDDTNVKIWLLAEPNATAAPSVLTRSRRCRRVVRPVAHHPAQVSLWCVGQQVGASDPHVSEPTCWTCSPHVETCVFEPHHCCHTWPTLLVWCRCSSRTKPWCRVRSCKGCEMTFSCSGVGHEIRHRAPDAESPSALHSGRGCPCRPVAPYPANPPDASGSRPWCQTLVRFSQLWTSYPKSPTDTARWSVGIASQSPKSKWSIVLTRGCWASWVPTKFPPWFSRFTLALTLTALYLTVIFLKISF